MSEPEPRPLQLIDNVTKPISFLGSAIIFLSILKSYIFYATFGIRVTNYISFSEAILLFLNEIAILVLYFGLLLSLFGLVYYISRLKNKTQTPLSLLLPGRNASLFHKFFCLALYVYPLFYLFYALVRNVYYYGRPVMFFFLLVCVITMEILIILYAVGLWKRLNMNRTASGKKVFLYAFSISIIFFYTWSLDRQLFLFHRNKINKVVTAYQSGKQISITNRDIQFLGSTAKYIFCYNKSREVAIIIDASKFERIEFGKYPRLPGFSIFDLLFH